MSRIYKICVVNNLTESAGEVFAIKPYLESFDSFKDEIFIRMPELKTQSLKIYYQDADGDNVTIFNALDFGIFQEQKINKVFVVKSAPVKTVLFQENAPTASTSAPRAPRHANVICDECDKEIYGYRYKCLECHDFDLCMECEPKSHNHHLMIRIADPSDADICYKSKLGKRFLRHRRSESLCSKPDEKIGKHHHHHKRHASSASVRPPHPFGDLVYGVLQSFAGTNQNAATNTEAPSQGTNGANQPKTDNAAPKAAPTKTTKPSTPTSAPSYGFNVENPNPNPKSPCVPLKQSIDMLSHMAHNFAAMMDPFAVYMDQNASASASSAAADASAAASLAAAAAATSAKAAELAATTNENVSTSVNAEKEPMTIDEEVSTADKEPKKSNVMIIDCSDDEDADLRNLVTSLQVTPNPTSENAPEANKKDSIDNSIEREKGSPSREWTFIERNEIADSAGASVSTGAIPKSTPPQAGNSGNNVDYAELSRLLSTHINAQVNAEKPQETPVAPPQTEEKAQMDTTDIGSKSTKTPPPTPLHPDARVNESLTAMMAMGFSNEGGWLSQLLETVDGSISNALDLLQPHK